MTWRAPRLVMAGPPVPLCLHCQQSPVLPQLALDSLVLAGDPPLRLPGSAISFLHAAPGPCCCGNRRVWGLRARTSLPSLPLGPFDVSPIVPRTASCWALGVFLPLRGGCA